MDINFCRRCAAPVTQLTPKNSFRCQNGHQLFYDATPAAGAVLVNEQGHILLNVRAINPGKGQLCIPGGYSNYGESLEMTLERELHEELGLTPADYTKPQYLTSAEDEYPWQGDITRLLAVAFWARLNPGFTITPGDDAAAVKWFAPTAVPREQLAFPASHNHFLDVFIAQQKL